METAGQSVSETSAATGEKEKISDNRARRSRSRSQNGDAEPSCKRQAVERSNLQETRERNNEESKKSDMEMSNGISCEHGDLPVTRDSPVCESALDVVKDLNVGKETHSEEAVGHDPKIGSEPSGDIVKDQDVGEASSEPNDDSNPKIRSALSEVVAKAPDTENSAQREEKAGTGGDTLGDTLKAPDGEQETQSGEKASDMDLKTGREDAVGAPLAGHRKIASRERSRSRDAHHATQTQTVKSSDACNGDVEKKPKSDVASSEQHSAVKLPEPPAPPTASLLPPSPIPPVQSARPVIPPVPQVALPERTRLIVTIPVKVQTRVDKTLGDVRQELKSGGCLPHAGSFYIKGDGRPLDDTTPIGNLSDVRLLLSSEPNLRPWQLCLAHRIGQQLVAARAVSLGGGMSVEAMLARNPYYKTKMCNQWVQNSGRCIRGVRCVYAHGQGEMRPPVVGVLVPRFFMPQMQAGMMRPGMPPFMLAGGMLRPGGLPIPPAVSQPSQPEVVFTVDEAEEKKRAERARRFAPKDKASFEREEKDANANASEETMAASTAESDAIAMGKEDIDGSVELPLPPMPPIGMLPGADETVAMSEEQIADYLLEMQQQFIQFDGDQEFPLPPGFPMPEFPPTGAGAELPLPGVPLPEPPVPPPLAAAEDASPLEAPVDGQKQDKSESESKPETKAPLSESESVQKS